MEDFFSSMVFNDMEEENNDSDLINEYQQCHVQKVMYPQEIIETVDLGSIYEEQHTFQSKHSLTEREFKLVSTLSALSVFPRAVGCPYQIYNLKDYSHYDLYALMNRSIEWRNREGEVVCFKVPNLGVPYLKDSKVEDISFELVGGFKGTTSDYLRRADIKCDGVTVPVVTSTDGRSYMMINECGFTCNIARGYSGDFLEKVGQVYYGFGPGCLRTRHRVLEYRNIYDLDLRTDSEGYVVSYELEVAKVVQRPTIDLLVKNGIAYDANGNAHFTHVSVDYNAKIVSFYLNGEIEGVRDDKVTPNTQDSCEEAKDAVSWVDFVKVVPAPFNNPVFDIRNVDTNILHNHQEYRRKTIPEPCRGIPWNKNFRYKDLQKLVKKKCRKGSFDNKGFIKILRSKGVMFDYECMIKYLGWCGIYRRRNVWQYSQYSLLTVPYCSRIVNASKPCTCDKWLL